jgi:hypothetical protein
MALVGSATSATSGLFAFLIIFGFAPALPFFSLALAFLPPRTITVV